jgi:serine/threonine-protein kinase HipA
VRRFDVTSDGRLHQHTLGGLLHVDYNDPGASSYEEYFRAILRLGMAYAPLEQAYVRMLFNVVGVNQDDHVKNLSFHMDGHGRWSLSPAYDLAFARGSGFTAKHQMRVRDKTSGITAGDLLAVGHDFGINDPAALLRRVRASVARVAEFARRYRVSESAIAELEHGIAERNAELGG